jgi:hypothetical protein
MHHALSRKTWKRAQMYPNVCKGDPITILQMLMSALPEDTDLEARLLAHGNDKSLELDLGLLDIALDRDDARALELMAFARCFRADFSYRSSEEEEEEGKSEATSSHVDDLTTAATENVADEFRQIPRCEVCKNTFQTASQYVLRFELIRNDSEAFSC